MRVLIAPCSFKESLTAKSAAEVLARVVRAHGHTPDLAPIADGGEGTLEILKAPLGLRLRTARVPGAMGGLVRARFGVGDELVVLEAAEAIGLAQVPRHQRRPLDASSLGLGRLLVRALELQPRRILVGLGGSATVDGGAGLLAALGVRFLDARGRELMPTPRALTRLARVDRSGLDPRVARTELTVLTDVRSPLLGPRGAELYMAQKGVRPAELPALRALLRRLHPGASARVPGAGAAGGLGAALHSVGARLVPGIDVVLEAQRMRARIAESDLVITGEGRLDRQTLEGKALAALARVCRQEKKPLLALCGRVELAPAELRKVGVIALSVVPGPCTVDEAVRHAAANLDRSADAALALIDARR